MPEPMPATARIEIGHRIQVLRKQAERARESAEELVVKSYELDANAKHFDALADQYEQLL